MRPAPCSGPSPAFRIPNAANATAHRIIDDWLRDRLLADPEQLVILLGAGFDARAFRLPGGRWVEIDQPALIAHKDRVLPAARAPQPLNAHGNRLRHGTAGGQAPAIRGRAPRRRDGGREHVSLPGRS